MRGFFARTPAGREDTWETVAIARARGVSAAGMSVARETGGRETIRAGGVMRRSLVFGLLLFFTACDSGGPSVDVVDAPALSGFASCQELESRIEEKAIREMNADIDRIIDDLDDKDGGFDGGVVSLPAPSATAAPTENRGAGEYTTTNTQERDVDEPDFVKNDGSRLFVLHGRTLLGLATWPAETTRLVSQTRIEGQPTTMLLDRNRLVVFSAVSIPGLGTPGSPRPLPSSMPDIYMPSNALKVTVLDVSSEIPAVLDERYLEGTFVAARRSGSSVRIVSSAGRRGPELLYWPEEEVRWSSRSAARAALERVRAENVRRIKASVLDDWLPRAFTGGSGGLRPVQRECGSFFATNASTRLGFTTVSTLELAGLGTRHATILSATDLAYASRDALYLAASHEWFRRRSETNVREDHTYLFQFDLASDPRDVRYLGAGGVPGSILDSFSMDEEGGYLRVATTRRTWLGWQLKSTTNGLSVLQAAGGRLLNVAELRGLARDEQLYSARFEGKRGYLVTFRRVDPLFTLDLGDPRQPRVAGELKVPGYSTYLHALGATHLLTIGREVSDDGRLVGGVQLQIFDVSNLAAPALQHRYLLGSRSSSSEAEYDHKAFTYFSSRGLLGIPFSDWSESRQYGFASTLELLRATAEAGIAPVGSIEHGDLVQGASRIWGWNPQVRRSVMMDDYVYSISYGGLKVHDVRELSRALVTIPFAGVE